MKNEFSQENSEKRMLDVFREITLLVRRDQPSIKNRKWPLKAAPFQKI